MIIELRGQSLMTEQSSRRLITRSAVSLQLPLPLAYKERLRRLEGVETVSEYQWFPCYYQQPREPMITIAADPEFAGTDPDYPVPPDELAAFRADPASALVPVKMM